MSPAAAIASAQRPRVVVTLIISPPWLGTRLVCPGGWVSGPALRLWPLAWGSWVSPGESAVAGAVGGGALVGADPPGRAGTGVGATGGDPRAGGGAGRMPLL